ncbi:MAG: hypothetical protein ABI488_23540 [Polyangiaceae bacterium]
MFETLPTVCFVAGTLLSGLAGGHTGGVPFTLGPAHTRASVSKTSGGAGGELYLTEQDSADVCISTDARNFLHRFPAVKALAFEAVAQLRQRIQLRNLRLDMFVDPESAAAPAQAFLVATAADAFPRAQDGLRLFDEEWWLDNCQRADGRLQVTIEFG